MQSAHWYTSPLSYDTVRKLSRSLGTSEVMAAVLARRGYSDPRSANEFLSAKGKIHDPFLLDGLQAACERLRQAISGREKICVHGDYDVDGITATALLVNVLRGLGGKVSFHLPNRFSEGYGISPHTVSRIAGDGTALLLTVDCGITARKELEQAAALGLDSIVVDHHRPVAESLPPGIIISPLLCDYPFKELAGVGLAFKLAQGLLLDIEGEQPDEFPPLLQHQLDLVALGTIADVVPLLDENRSLVKRGLVQMARTRHPGLRALMKVGLVEPSRLNTGLVAFRLAPRINAAGRLDDPAQALDLLLAESGQEAEELAVSLDALNRERQKIENRMLAEAQEMVARWPEEQRERYGYVLSSPGWHEGVIGIVASRLVELHYRPVIMIAEGDEQGKGSGRSIPPFDLHESLVELAEMLTSFGGHRAACGLTIDLAHLDGFRENFAAIADRRLSQLDPRPSRYVDAMVSGRELTLELAEELARMEPFGLGNPSVDLVATGASIHGGRRTRDGQHLQCRVESGGASSSAIGFGQAFLLDKMETGASWDVVFRLERNEFSGSVSPQLNLRELFLRGPKTNEHASHCDSRCSVACSDRVQGDEFWKIVRYGAALPDSWQGGHEQQPADGSPVAGERVIDRRNYGGIPQQVARLVSGGEDVLLLVADVARRQRLLSHDLPINNRMVGQMLFASSRCSRATIDERMNRLAEKGDSPTLMMVDFVTLTANPGIAGSFDHLVFIDPPLNQDVFRSITDLATQAYIHLIYCHDEVQFTKRVLEHEYDLRSPLAKVYRRLKTGKAHPLDETSERLLLAGGKYLRQPLMVARCFRVLEELDLIAIEETGEGPILTLPKTKKTDLKKSPTYNFTQEFYEKCLKYLNRLKDTKTI